MEKEKKGRLVIHSAARLNGAPQEWQTLVNLGNFTSNQDDMVQIEVDYITPIVAGSLISTNYWDTIEVLLDFIPQQYSYDNSTQTDTRHLAFMEKEYGTLQQANYANDGFLKPSNGSRTLQQWKFSQKPSRMVVRPEVLQNKLWNIRLKFISQPAGNMVNWINQSVPGVTPGVSNLQPGPQTEQLVVGDYKIVFSCTK